jgi:hypothetical protein
VDNLTTTPKKSPAGCSLPGGVLQKNTVREGRAMQRLPRLCRPLRRCGLWRTCQYCAAARQKLIADRAEDLAQQFGTLFLSVLTPHDKTAAAIHKIRAALLRRAFAPAGLWSVETGKKLGGLHLNLIAPAPIYSALRGCEIWSQAIKTSARAAAAYINKPEGFPDRAEYSGNLTGSWGHIADILTARHMPATVQAASIEAALSKHSPEHYLREAFASREKPPSEKQPTRAEYQQIARRNLPNLYAVLRNRQPGED